MASDGKYISIEFNSTINKNTTEYNAEGAWIDSSNVRFRNGRPETRKGWLEYNLDRPFAGVSRDIDIFRELNGKTHITVGTHRRAEIEQGNIVYDITPIESSASGTDIIETSSGSTEIVLSVPAHGRAVGSEVLISAASSVGGLTLGGQNYEITEILSANRFSVETSVTATSDAVGGGATTIDMLLAAGNADNGFTGGWGAGTWGTPGETSSAGWGAPRTATFEDPLRQWSIDVWGEDLLAAPRGGKVYHWDATTSVTTRYQPVTAAPSANNLIKVVGPKRYLVSYGCTPTSNQALDPLQVRWSDSENFNDWNASATNEAGSFRLAGGNKIVGVESGRKETLVFTDSEVYSQRFVGSQFVFGFDEVSKNAGLIAQHATAEVDGVVYWMGRNKFFAYDGYVRKLESSVEDFVFDNINTEQKEKIFCATNVDYDEITWFYPSTGSTEIDSYVVFNYQEGSWHTGTIDRVVWKDSGIFDEPLAVGSDGVAYSHESGNNDSANALDKYIESAYFDLGEGTDVMLADQIIPDFEMEGRLFITIYGKRFPSDTQETVKGPYPVSAGTDVINMRFRGRQAKIRYSTSAIDSSFEAGKVRVRIRPDGER